MRNYICSILLLLATSIAGAQTTINGSFVYGSITRTYSFYVPAAYRPGQAVPLVLNLHGLSTDGAYQAQYRDFRPIADTANFIVAHPNGSTILGQRFWNYGNVLGSRVDDVGFLEALIDTIASRYTINPQRIYCAGMSNGSFMSYYLACKSTRFAAIGAVTGSMSVTMYNACRPAHPVPVTHIHGTADNTNPYNGTSSMKAVESVISFWASQNGCGPVPAMTAISDINTSDNARGERYVYSGGINGNTVELIKVIGGGHSWPGIIAPNSNAVTCMDFNAGVEIWRFFSRHQQLPATTGAGRATAAVRIWPNPAKEYVYIQADNEGSITGIRVSDLQGRIIQNHASGQIRYADADQRQVMLDVRQLHPGNYMISISGNGFSATKQLLITR